MSDEIIENSSSTLSDEQRTILDFYHVQYGDHIDPIKFALCAEVVTGQKYIELPPYLDRSCPTVRY